MKNINKITVVGSGYVGMSLAVLLSRNNDVIINDIDLDKVQKINEKKSTIYDPDISFYLKNKNLSLFATSDKATAYKDAEFIIIAVPTNYDEKENYFDTAILDNVIGEAVELNNDALIVIKSTLPVGHTELLRNKFKTEKIIFSPEFLREGSALKDNLYPSRIIIGGNCSESRNFAKLMINASKKDNINTLFINSTEAEAVKLFANNYLAMRVSFFNELDSYAMANHLNSKSIIDGVCLDERIGTGYNNPSFGYGGYCLPKDTKQLLANFDSVPQKLVESIVSSNETRKDFITKEILNLNPNLVGIYRLIMKQDSDNFRSSAIQGIIKRLKKNKIEILIYEPSFQESTYQEIKVTKDLDYFKKSSNLIIANRFSDELEDVSDKVFTRDIFNDN